MRAVRGFTRSPGLAPLTPREDHRSLPASRPPTRVFTSELLSRTNISIGIARVRSQTGLAGACAAVLREVLPSNFHVFVLLRRRQRVIAVLTPLPRVPGVGLPELMVADRLAG